MILVCGEALVDLVTQADADVVRVSPGGSPANTAVGLGRLGQPAALLARLARDGFGHLLRRHLTESGVDLGHAADAAEPTTLALATLDEQRRADYTFYIDGCADGNWTRADLPAALPDDCRAVHVSGSLATAVPAMGDVLERLLVAEHGRRVLSFDPNPRPALASDPAAVLARVERWLGLVNLVKVSSDDLAWLYPGETIESVADRWSRGGPELVVVTHGGDGVSAWRDGPLLHLPAEKVDVVDTVGAGDSLAAGLLDWLARHDALAEGRIRALPPDDLADGLTFALHVAALCCARAGADPPWRHELERHEPGQV